MLELLFDRHSQSAVHAYARFSGRNIGVGIFTLATILSAYAMVTIAQIPFPPDPAKEAFGHIFSVAVASGREQPVRSSELATRFFNETAFIETLPLTEAELRQMPSQKRTLHEMIITGNANVTHIGGNSTHPFMLDEYVLPYGSMIRNHCKMRTPANATSLMPSVGLPSTLRGMEIMMAPQMCFRLIVMLTISIRWVATMVADYRVATVDGCPTFVKWTAALHTPTVIIQTISISLLTTLHSEIDVTIRDMIPLSLMCFCIASIVDIAALIILDRAKEAPLGVRTARKFIFLIAFFTFPVVYRAHVEFLDWRVCSIDVPWWTALCEYSFALSVAANCLLQMIEFLNVELSVHMSEEESDMRTLHSFEYVPFASVEERRPSIYSGKRSGQCDFVIGEYFDAPLTFARFANMRAFEVVRGTTLEYGSHFEDYSKPVGTVCSTHTEYSNPVAPPLLVASGVVISYRRTL